MRCNYLATRCSQQAVNGLLHCSALHWIYSTTCCRKFWMIGSGLYLTGGLRGLTPLARGSWPPPESSAEPLWGSTLTPGLVISNIDIDVDIIDDTFDVWISISTILSYKSIDRGIDDNLLAFFVDITSILLNWHAKWGSSEYVPFLGGLTTCRFWAVWLHADIGR